MPALVEIGNERGPIRHRMGRARQLLRESSAPKLGSTPGRAATFASQPKGTDWRSCQRYVQPFSVLCTPRHINVARIVHSDPCRNRQGVGAVPRSVDDLGDTTRGPDLEGIVTTHARQVDVPEPIGCDRKGRGRSPNQSRPRAM